MNSDLDLLKNEIYTVIEDFDKFQITTDNSDLRRYHMYINYFCTDIDKKNRRSMFSLDFTPRNILRPHFGKRFPIE